MIRVSDLTPSQWMRPAQSSVARTADTRDATSWFDVDAMSAGVTISGDLSAAARGLSVEQHAQRVLAQLCGEPDSA